MPQRRLDRGLGLVGVQARLPDQFRVREGLVVLAGGQGHEQPALARPGLVPHAAEVVVGLEEEVAVEVGGEQRLQVGEG